MGHNGLFSPYSYYKILFSLFCAVNREMTHIARMRLGY
jgi:hypothetical protein